MPNLHELAKGIKSGDRQAFESLYELYATRVAGFVLRFVSCKSDCDDIVQDTFVAAYVGSKSYTGRSQPLAWLLGIAVRRCRDQNRKRTTPLTDNGDLENVVELNASIRQTLEDIVIEGLELDNALSRLEPLFREALLLVASQGLTYKEAADVMGEPVGTVKWRASTASAQMRKYLKEHVEEVDELRKITI